MTEMKNICGKIPKDLHEKVREEIELTESSTQKFIQQVIEEHFERLAGKGEMSMGTARTIAVQVSEELFQRLKTVIAFLLSVSLHTTYSKDAWKAIHNTYQRYRCCFAPAPSRSNNVCIAQSQASPPLHIFHLRQEIHHLIRDILSRWICSTLFRKDRKTSILFRRFWKKRTESGWKKSSKRRSKKVFGN